MYQDNKSLPIFKHDIIRRVIEKIEAWEEQKGKKSSINLNWRIREELLGELSFQLIANKTNLSLSEQEVTNILLPLIEMLEKQRKIQSGLDMTSIIYDLCSTGIISYAENRLSFIHRIFINYFASKALALKFEINPQVIQNLIERPEWEDVIIGTSAHLLNASILIELLMDKNISLAEMSYVQGKNIEKEITEKILIALQKHIAGRIYEKRQYALAILAQINSQATTKLFYKIFRESKYIDVKKVAIEEIAKQKTAEAKNLVLEQLTWDEGGPYVGSSQGSVAKALANFDVEEQLKIIDIWRKEPDMYTNDDCYQALLQVHSQGRMTEKLEQAIFDFFIEADTDFSKHSKESYLRTLLQKINNEKFVDPLIQQFDVERKDNIMFPSYVADILASYKSKEVAEKLVKYALDDKTPLNIRKGCTQSLIKRNDIDIKVYQTLINENDVWLKHYALEGIEKSTLKEVKELAFKFYDSGNPLLQGSAIDLLANKGLLIELLQLKNFYRNITYPNFRKLLYLIRKHKIIKFIPVLDWWNKYIINDDRLTAEIAYTYYLLGEQEKAKAIIDNLTNSQRYVNDYVYTDILEMLPEFDFDYAFGVLQKVILLVNEMKTREHRHYIENQYVECIEKLSNKRTLPILKELATKFAKSKDVTMIERTCRAINRIASQDDEEWYINFIQSFPEMQRYDLRRAIEGLGIVGTNTSLKVIKDVLKNHTELWDDDNVIDTAYESIKSIYTNQGINRDVDESDLF